MPAQTALDLDPVDPMMNFRVVQAAYYARRYDAAIRSARTAIDLAPDFQSPCAYLASALLATGHREEAWTMTQKAKELGHGLPFCEGGFGYIAGTLGHTAEALNVISDLTARRDRCYGPALPIAWTWLGLGDVDSWPHAPAMTMIKEGTVYGFDQAHYTGNGRHGDGDGHSSAGHMTVIWQTYGGQVISADPAHSHTDPVVFRRESGE